MLVKTDYGILRESARQIRFEQVPGNQATNVQQAIQSVTNVVPTARLPAANPSITVTTSDVEVGIDTGTSGVTVSLPAVAGWSVANADGLALVIFDYTGHASAHNIQFVLSGSDQFVQGISPVIATNFGLLRLRPIISTPNKWYVQSVG